MQAAAPDFSADFGVITDALRFHAVEAPQRRALDDGTVALDYAALDALMDRVAAALQRDGLRPGDTVALCAAPSVWYAAVFLGALRAGAAVAPLAPGVPPEALARMLGDAGARWLCNDPQASAAPAGVAQITLDLAGLERWLPPVGSRPAPVSPQPGWPFNIIYSSGTTGEPKGIVQPHGMRWMHVRRGNAYGYGAGTVALLSTPLYSNTTLVVLFPALAWGGTVLLMPKFDARRYLEIAAAQRVTHTMLVPVQYQRLLALPDFDRFDLRSFHTKFCTSAPFAAALKAEVMRRWPGALVEFYGMTEGGGTCILDCGAWPDKLHTVGRPSEGHDIRVIDDDGNTLPAGEAGEVVGHSPAMMTGYHARPAATRAAEWFSPDGRRFIRTGDIGRFDADGFLTLLDRKKDMVISGGFNVYPSDLEAVLRSHPAVADAAVVGVPSEQWGETPVAFVVLHAGQGTDDNGADALRDWLNQRVGKTQRVSVLTVLAELPRSPIGKVLKRTLREQHLAG